jgi:hypothetical protein
MIYNALLTPILSTTNHATATLRVTITFEIQRTLAPRFSQINNHPKRRRIDLEEVDRNDVDQALTVITAALEEGVELPSFIVTELPQYTANYVVNRPDYSQYTILSETGFLRFFLAILWLKSSQKK